MSTEQDDLEKLLADILDDSIPLPTTVSAAANKAGGMGNLVMKGPDTFFDPLDVAASMEVSGEMVLADVFKDSGERTEPKVSLNKMPVFQADDFAETMDIRNFATLVTLNTAKWHAKVRDRQASKDAATMGEASQDAFETRKRLLVGADDTLKVIHKAIEQARAAHYELTLPWTTTGLNDLGKRTGGRLLPNTLFMEYTRVMAEHKAAMKAALAIFVPLYPSLISIAQTKLGKRFDPSEYPNPASIESHFDLSFDFQPIPQGDDFKGLPQAQLEALARKVNENTERMTQNAMQDGWMRLYTVVERMAERLSSPDKTFHDTLVTNVRDVAGLLEHLNILQDAKVEALRQRVLDELCITEPKVLRENLKSRALVAKQATEILQEMGQ